MASVDTCVLVSASLRRDPTRWQHCIDAQRRLLERRVLSSHRGDARLTFSVVEYPGRPTPPGHRLYRFVLQHGAPAGTGTIERRR